MDQPSLRSIQAGIRKDDLTLLRDLICFLRTVLEPGVGSTRATTRTPVPVVCHSSLALILTQSKEKEPHVSVSTEVPVSYLIHISTLVANISYKKRSIKDRHRALPWHNLEYLHHLLQPSQHNGILYTLFLS